MTKRYYGIIFIILIILCLILSQLFYIKCIKKDKDNTINLEKIQEEPKETKENEDITATTDIYEYIDTSDFSNSDIIGKIKIDDTDIDEYVLKTVDNDYYLSHNIYKEYDVAGSVFMDFRNDFNDKKILIFGHNANNLYETPFFSLGQYLDQNFYNNHKYINLNLNNKRSKWIIFSVLIVNKGNNFHMQLDFDNNEWKEHIDYIKSNSIYDTSVNVSYEDKIIILQTCNYNPENTYILICAKKI